MKALIIVALTLVAAPATFAAGQVLNDADCEAVWKHAGGKALTAEAAKPNVSNFEQVDADKNGSIDYREFKEGCKAGLVHKTAK